MNEKTVRYRGGGISYGVDVSPKGISVSQIRDTVEEKILFSGRRPVFSLTVRVLENGKEICVNSEKGWESVSADENAMIFAGNALIPGVSVIISVSKTEEFLTFDTEVINTNEKLSAYKCDQPSLWFTKNRNVRFFYPYGCGESKVSTIKGGWNSEQSYPSYGASMQYLAFWNEVTRRGVYYGCHDKAPASKKLCCIGDPHENDFCLKSWQYLTGITDGKNSQKLSGSICMSAFDGDWYDAALIYKKFIEEEALYNSEYDENGKKGVPEWLRSTDCWFNTRVIDDGDFAEDIIKQAEVLGVKPAIHLYYWHKIPYDNDYPHYFPVKDNVIPGLKKLHDAGIKVMPYINGRLWDTRDRGMEDFEFTSVAKPNCTKDLNGEPITESYASKEADGSSVVLSVMCPSTTLWQDKVASLVKQLEETGFDGAYIDQIAAAEAKTCTDRTHKHPSGGGEWWCAAYNTMLERIDRNRGKDFCLTTECTADPFSRHLDAYLTWIWVKNDQVPAFPAIFSDKVLTYGTDFRALGKLDYDLFGTIDETGVRIFASQSFLFGQQMGWMTPELFSRMPHQDFFCKLVRARATFRDYFLAGRVLRPPVITDDGEKLILTKCREAYNGYVEAQCVNGMIWQSKKTGRKVLILVNSGKTDVNAKVKSILPSGKYTFKGDLETEFEIKKGEFEIKMPPLSYCYTEVE